MEKFEHYMGYVIYDVDSQVLLPTLFTQDKLIQFAHDKDLMLSCDMRICSQTVSTQPAQLVGRTFLKKYSGEVVYRVMEVDSDCSMF